MTEKQRDVCGIGNALVDVVCNVDEGFLEKRGLTKGAMTLIPADRAEELYSAMPSTVECSGGSAANTVVGLASLGASVSYIGKVKNDAMGKDFRWDIRKTGVGFDVPLSQSGPPTGRCLVFVTPDAQRTMQTFLGASATLSPADIDPDAIRAARIVYLEGYLFDPEPAQAAFRHAAQIAHQHGHQVALSLSDPFCVDRHRPEFLDLVSRHVDVLFGNEDEVIALFQTGTLESVLERLPATCKLAVITLGARGSLVVSRDGILTVPVEPVTRVVDTTGAGDLYAAGFLYGLTRGLDLPTCGRLGSIAAAEIVGHPGARPENPLRRLVQAKLNRTV